MQFSGNKNIKHNRSVFALKSHHGIYDEQKLRATKAKSTQMEWQHIESKEASGPIICHRIKVVYLFYPFIFRMK